MASSPVGSGVVSLRDVQREATRLTIIQAAGSCFGRQGFAATTVEDIAQAAGTTRTTFYVHFRGKADVIAALGESIVRDTQLLYDELEAAVASGERDELRAWFRRSFNFWERAGAVIRAEEEAASIHPEVQDRRGRMFQGGVDAIANGLMTAGVSDQEGCRVRGLLAYSQLHTLFQRWIRVGWDVDPDQVLDVMIDMWLAVFR